MALKTSSLIKKDFFLIGKKFSKNIVPKVILSSKNRGNYLANLVFGVIYENFMES